MYTCPLVRGIQKNAYGIILSDKKVTETEL